MKTVLGALLLLIPSCELWGAVPNDPDCANLEIQASSELLLSDRELRFSAHAQNRGHGELSFAARLSTLAGANSGVNTGALWAIVGRASPRAPEEYPFRLLAVVNRTDLASQLAPESPAGEARLVYTLTEGPGDELTSAALPFTLIFEYSLGRLESQSVWASRFHSLASASGNARQAQLVQLVQAFASNAAGNADAPHLAQVRVNDARGGHAEQHELTLQGAALAVHPLRNTPRLEFIGDARLVGFVNDHAEAILAGSHRVPDAWLASVANVAPVSWQTSATIELERAFTRSTCSGCHDELGSAPNGFHLSENASGDVKLSAFLEGEELSRRERVQRVSLCNGSR